VNFRGCYTIAQESVGNVIEYSQARSAALPHWVPQPFRTHSLNNTCMY